MNNFNIKEVQTITYSFNLLRIKNDLAYHEKKWDAPKKNDWWKWWLFPKLGKDFSNTVNKNVFESNLKQYNLKQEHLQKLKLSLKKTM